MRKKQERIEVSEREERAHKIEEERIERQMKWRWNGRMMRRDENEKCCCFRSSLFFSPSFPLFFSSVSPTLLPLPSVTKVLSPRTDHYPEREKE